MKLFKKIVALTAMAAVCFAMAAPVSASAGTRAVDPGTELPSCPPHYFSVTSTYTQTSTSTHQYVAGYVDTDGDGIYETRVYGNCTITTTNTLQDWVCDKCRMISKGNVLSTSVVHSVNHPK